MPTISVRISDEERKRLLKYGPISESVRKGLELFEQQRKREDLKRSLDRLQLGHPVKISSDEIVRIIRKDRASH